MEGNLQTNQVEVKVKEVPSEEEFTPPLPSFGPYPDTTNDYNFNDEVVRLPFKFNIGDATLSKEQQDHLLNLVYGHQKVFSLHSEDLVFCDKLACSIPTMTDKPVHFPHRTIPWQLQGEVRKCLDTWLRQGIIRPSKSPYASQVVILRKKTREIQLGVDYQKLNSTVVRDAFAFPCINEALQAAHNCWWFTSFDLMQGYLQMPVEVADIQKLHLVLDHLAYMSLLICHSGCPIWVQFLLPRQYVPRRSTICTTPIVLRWLTCICCQHRLNVEPYWISVQMAGRIQFEGKTPQKVIFQCSIAFLEPCTICRWYTCKPWEGKEMASPNQPKELQSFLRLTSYYHQFIPKFTAIAKCLQQLIGPANHQK